MDIDPEYVKANRANGQMTDRQDLGMVERSMAYGCSATSNGKPNEYKLNLVALSTLNATAVMVDGRPRVLTTIDGKAAYLTFVYVDSTDNWIGLPTVNYVEISGELVDGGGAVSQRIKP
jgi:hypothetical protein